MYRVVSALFALFVSLAAASAQSPPTPVPAQAPAEVSAQIPADSRLKSIADNKTIRIAYRTDAAPFAFESPAGGPVGYSLDLCQMVTKSIAQQLGSAGPQDRLDPGDGADAFFGDRRGQGRS